MGLAIARAAIAAGHSATLITTIRNSEFGIRNSELKIVCVESAAEMFEAVKKHFPRCDCLVMAAAVADYAPEKKSKIKIKKFKRVLSLKLKPTVDILAWAGKNKRKNQHVCGFSLDDRNLRANAEKKLREKEIDMIIANPPAVIGSPRCRLWVKEVGGKWLPMAETMKRTAAARLIRIIEQSTQAE